ncbi:centromere protein Q [Echeneis naucrates]|uniref:Centromere protein Q n=1 Tax=Echeneis naucrates TaxID=173247 RepID=A0A665TTN7_ECHNA|nr:centromere protein Q-like [Echeneis naucrates]
MKAGRGSNRELSKTPKLNKKRRQEATKQETKHMDQVLEDDGTDIQPKPGQKRKGSSSVPTKAKKAKGRDSWELMPPFAILALENIMDLSILTTLALRRTEKKESQEHLNIMKNRFISQCGQLKVPVQKQKYLEHSSFSNQEEAKKSTVGKKTLDTLEGDLKAVVHALESAEEQSNALEHSCRTLRERVEEEEEKAKQIPEQRVLNLPHYLLQRDGTLDIWKRKTISDNDSEIMARKLGEILQKSEAIQDAQVLLLHAHKHFDQLVNPNLNLGSDIPR